ncbi:MAG: hypothetical protein PHX34_01865 [Candidatus Shapirobacteria bacterium]|nr:hypothetical protein [Candidatus Shapirobacteria bacterium]
MISYFLSLILLLISPTTVFATDASPSANNSNDIQTIREVVQQKVKEKLNLITTPESKPKSFFGTIQKITNNQIDINLNNETKTIITTDNTVFINLKRTKIALKDLKSGQEILALGYLNSQNQLETKRIIIFELKSVENNTQVVNGQIVDVSQTSPIFVIVPQANKNNQYQITTTTTEIKKIKTGQKAIIVIKPDPKMTNTFDLLKTISLSESTTSASPTQ